MSIFKDLVKNLGLTNITQSKKKYVTVSENNSEEEKEKAKYKVKNIDNLKQSEIIFEIPGLNFDDDSNYEDLMHDTLEKLISLKDIYIKYLKKIGTM